jgi:acyl-CoA thioester hydrolase
VTPAPLHVRLADLDQRGEVTPGRHLELFQEARIRFLMDLHTRGEKWSHHVVARTDVDLLAPVRHRAAAYDVRSWIGHLGERSFSIAAELADGDRVLARATSVMVAFDMETQRPTTMTPEQRARLEREID